MRPPQWSEPPDLRGLIEDYLKDPGPRASRSLAHGFLRSSLLRRLDRLDSDSEATKRQEKHRIARIAASLYYQPWSESDREQDHPSSDLPSATCYNSGQYAEEGTRASHSARAIQEACNGDLPRSKGCGREDEGQAEARYQKAALFLAWNLRDDQGTPDLGAAELVLDGLLFLLGIKPGEHFLEDGGKMAGVVLQSFLDRHKEPT
jgi:hypothetical protein